MSVELVALPHSIVQRLRNVAEKHGMSLEEYLIEIAVQDLDPSEKAREYIAAAEVLLRQAMNELKEGGIRQAAEKLWGAAALSVKAYAYWREGKRLASHRELWEYTRRMIEELGEWIHDSWASANEMHTCFYEGWCTSKHVELAMNRVRKLIETIAKKLRSM